LITPFPQTRLGEQRGASYIVGAILPPGGGEGERQLFGQHDAQWIKGEPGRDSILVFDNGTNRQPKRSRVLELRPDTLEQPYSVDPKGTLSWQFGDTRKPTHFYSNRISGTQRLPNGLTLICSGEQGHLWLVDRDGRVRWRYQNHFGEAATPRPGRPGGRPGASPIAVFKARMYLHDSPAVSRLIELSKEK
jgi:hypothetical protein